MVRKGHGLKNPLNNTKGTSIVNVIVAFVILLISAAMFQQALKISLNFMDKSSQIRQNLEAALEQYYTQKPSNFTSNTLRFSGTEGSFDIQLKQAEEQYQGLTLYYYSY